MASENHAFRISAAASGGDLEDSAVGEDEGAIGEGVAQVEDLFAEDADGVLEGGGGLVAEGVLDGGDDAFVGDVDGDVVFHGVFSFQGCGGWLGVMRISQSMVTLASRSIVFFSQRAPACQPQL